MRAFVEDVLSIAGISRVGGRTAGEIAERFLAKAAAQASGGGSGLNPENRAVIERYRAITGDPDAAAGAVRDLAREAGLDHPRSTRPSISSRSAPASWLRAACPWSASASPAASRATSTITPASSSRARPRAPGSPWWGGGRYDGLLQYLGSPVPVPAVGCAVWLSRLATRADGSTVDAPNPKDAAHG